MYIGNTLWGENGLHAFGNNSTESEPDETWNSVSQMGGGVALADFGRDPRSSDSLRGGRNSVFLSGK